jgi:hypothetical protein
MILYELKLLVDQEWLDVLDVISRHQEGFMWADVEAVEYVEVNE